MNPFDLKSALLAKHAQHVVLIHFPIALFLVGTGFDVAARWTRRAASRPTLAGAARLNMLAAAVFVWPTLVTGIMAWRWQFEGEKLQGLLLLHLCLGSSSAILISIVAWIHLRQPKASPLQLSRYRLALEIVTSLVIGLTAHIGGFLSGVNLG
ncbi:MAG TPA: DUF2231 domain-containing protein [Terriglobales bacterium]|jgi:uncharacterized membrane protein